MEDFVLYCLGYDVKEERYEKCCDKVKAVEYEYNGVVEYCGMNLKINEVVIKQNDGYYITRSECNSDEIFDKIRRELQEHFIGIKKSCDFKIDLLGQL